MGILAGYWKLSFRDVAADRIVAPAHVVLPGDTVIPLAWIKNLGSEPQGFRVVMRIDSKYRDVHNVYVRGGDSIQLGFSSWLATPEGQHTARCSTMLDGDIDRADDTCSEVFTVAATGIRGSGSEIAPKVFALDVPSPNPSRGAVTIRYALPKATDISLKLYDATGKLRAVLDQGRKAAGRYSLTLNIRHSRFDIAAGVYLVRLESPDFVRTQKIVIAQ